MIELLTQFNDTKLVNVSDYSSPVLNLISLPPLMII